MKLLQRPNPQKRLRLRQHQQDDALLHHLTGRDRKDRAAGECSGSDQIKEGFGKQTDCP